MFRVSIYSPCDLENELGEDFLRTERKSGLNENILPWHRAQYREVDFNAGLILHEQAVVLVSATFEYSDQEVAAEGWIKGCGIPRLQIISQYNAPELIIKSFTDLDMNLANISEAPTFLWGIWEFPRDGSLWVYDNLVETWFLHVLDLNNETWEKRLQ